MSCQARKKPEPELEIFAPGLAALRKFGGERNMKLRLPCLEEPSSCERPGCHDPKGSKKDPKGVISMPCGRSLAPEVFSEHQALERRPEQRTIDVGC